MKMVSLILVISLIATIIIFSGCTASNNPSTISDDVNQPLNGQDLAPAPVSQNIIPTVEKVEVIHFHATNQCYSCTTLGQLAESTINKYFSEELKSGKITFAHINVELAENQELVNKYGTTGSSLWIGIYSEVGFHKEQNTTVWYKINNPTEFEQYLSGIITKRVQGIIE